jgi:WD40 repeat protein
VFPEGGTIHGCQHGEKISVLFGGRKIAILHGGRSLEDPIESAAIGCSSQDRPSSLNALIVSDWIWNLKMIVHESADDPKVRSLTVALALANNACEVWSIKSKEDLSYSATRQRRIIGATRSITYSMCFFGWNQGLSGSYSDLIIASGTVSNKILVWTAVYEAESDSLVQPISGALAEITKTSSCVHERQCDEYCLQGHVGVIHAVMFNETGELLVSASDDRSVRLWKSTERGDWALVWTAWSHKARVWNVAFSSRGIVSCGEDAVAKIWCEIDGSLVGEVRVHYCQSLWSIDVHSSLALIGCNDGTAKLWNLCSTIIRTMDDFESGQEVRAATTVSICPVPDDRIHNHEATTSHPALTLPSNNGTQEARQHEIEKSKTQKQKKAKMKIKDQTLCGMEFYQSGESDRRLLVATRAGSLFSLCLESHTWEMFEPWCTAAMTINANHGSSLAVISSDRVAAVGTTRGDIVLVSLPSCDSNTTNVHRRVFSTESPLSIKSLAWLDNSTLLSFHIKGIVYVWRIQNTTNDAHNDEQDIEAFLILNTTTMAVPTCFAFSEARNTLFIGDSRGNIAVFLLVQSEDGTDVAPMSLAHRVHKKEYVNDILCFSNDKIISVGNDGCIRHSGFNDSGELACVLSLPLSSLPGPSHIYQYSIGGKRAVIVAGYHGNAFLAFDLNSGYELFRIDTGGRQRNHSCSIALNPAWQHFPAAYGVAVCVKRSDGRNEMLLYYLPRASQAPAQLPVNFSIGASLHGEPIFDLSVFTSCPRAEYNVLLSGSEDCTAKVSIVKQCTIVESMMLPTQSSCVRAVCSSRHVNENTSLLVVCGGQMAVEFYSLTDEIKREKHSSDTFILDGVTIQSLGKGYYPFKPSMDPRINVVKSVPVSLIDADDTSDHIVLTGDSDGSIYLFLLSLKQTVHRTTPGQLLYELERPVLAIEVMVSPSPSELIILAGTTDGSVVMWLLPLGDLSVLVSPIGRYEAHQVGTNSISALLTETFGDRYRLQICSGGDDQSIVVCTVDLFRNNEQNFSTRMHVVRVTKVDVASSSAIKGVKHLDKSHILSVGYSQILAIWRLSSDRSALKLLSTYAVDVADVNCFSLSAAGNLVAIGGMGVEFVSVSETGLQVH